MLAMDDLRHPKPKCKCGVEPTSRADPASLTARTTQESNSAVPTLYVLVIVDNRDQAPRLTVEVIEQRMTFALHLLQLAAGLSAGVSPLTAWHCNGKSCWRPAHLNQSVCRPQPCPTPVAVPCEALAAVPGCDCGAEESKFDAVRQQAEDCAAELTAAIDAFESRRKASAGAISANEAALATSRALAASLQAELQQHLRDRDALG